MQLDLLGLSDLDSEPAITYQNTVDVYSITTEGALRLRARFPSGATADLAVDGVPFGEPAVPWERAAALQVGIDFLSIEPGASEEVDLPMAEALTSDYVELYNKGDSLGLAFRAYVPADGTVRVVAQNFTAAAIDPPNIDFLMFFTRAL
jgi:hypothetical protein